MTSTEHDLAGLSSEEKRALLAELIGESEAGGDLLPAQRRFWVLNQVSPQVPTHVVRVVDVSGALDVARLRGAVGAVLDVHPDLRSRFAGVAGQPVRLVDERCDPDVVEIDVRGGEAEVERIRLREAGRAFDIERAPLVRLAVLHRGPEDHQIVLTAHQLVADERVGDQLLEMIAAAHDTGRAVPARPDRPSCRRVAERTAAWLRSPQARRERDFWVRRLSAAPVLDLPTDFPRPTDRMPSLRGGRTASELPAAVVARLREAGHTGAGDLVLAALGVVLARYTGERDVTVGLPVEAPPGGDTDVLGPVENTVVLRADIDPGLGLAALATRVGEERTEISEHRGLPFERVLTELAGEVDLSRSALHQVRFVHRSLPGPAPRTVAGAAWTPVDVGVGIAAFDLSVRLAERDDGAALVADFDADVFGEQTVRLLLDHVVRVVDAGLADPDGPAAELSLFSGEDLDAVLAAGVGAAGDPLPEEALHELVSAQAARTPDAPAVLAGPRRLSYRELDEWSNRIAHELRDRGAGRGVLVGVIAARTAGTVAAFLGALKAGAGYVPVAPDQPAERLRSLLHDNGIRIVVAPDSASRTLQPHACDPWLGVDDPEVLARSATAPGVVVDPDDVAYVVFTSGSTGRPKGVVVPHRQVVHSTQARIDIEPEAPAAYAIPVALSFDASVAGLYWTLTTGGRVVLPDEREVRDPAMLASLVQRERITHLTHMPSYYQLLLAAGGRKLISLKQVAAGGDVFPAQLAVDHYATLPWTRLYNDYGPTEVTVWASTRLSTAHERGASVPIGRPIRGTSVHLLDDRMQPVPPGVPGEIVVGGPGLARGYLGAPGATADRFVPDPFGEPGSRLYRTGDVARRLPDGELEFLGRVDAQMKIRGFRIEPGEIENALVRHPDVLAAAVDRRGGTEDDGRLVAWVVPAEGATFSAAALLAHLRLLLPAHMIPSAVVESAGFPVGASGKVDRRRLPDPVPARAELPEAEVPRRRIEKEVAEVFAESLGLPRLGLHDDFFEFGGSSLQLSRVGTRLSQAYGMELPLHALFSTPTVAGVASRIELYEREGFEGLRRTRDAADDLDREAELDPSITGEGLPWADFFSPKGVLLTGATGYFGAFLLDQLVEQTQAEIYCLVRARDAASAKARLRAACELYEIPWDDRFERRVRAVVGDLSRPHFDLPQPEFEELSRSVDVIYHNGALVNFSLPYSALKAPNVDGTVEVLRLASRHKVKQVHFVSTIDVFIAGHMQRPFLELELPQRPPQVPFSYPQSKWVSEKMITTARERGLPVTIFRPSIMMGHPRTGACHASNYVLTALRGFLEFGILPDYPESMNAVSLDYASQAMVHVSRQEASLGNIYHIWNTDAIPHNALFPWIESFGYRFDVVPFDDAVKMAIEAGPEHPVYPMVPVLLLYTSGDAGLEMSMDTEHAIDNSSECRNLLDGIAGTGYTPAPLDEKYMHDCLAYLVRHGQLDPPSAFPRR